MICRDWLDNRCMRGKKCEYLHKFDHESEEEVESNTKVPKPTTVDPRKHTVVCKHWLKKMCMKDNKCEFLHQLDLSRMPACTNSSKGKACSFDGCIFKHDEAPENKECSKYKLGYCDLGRHCPSRHEKLYPDKAPKYLLDWYMLELIKNSNVPMPRAFPKLDHLYEKETEEKPPFPGKSRYFLVKAASKAMLDISQKNSIWATNKGNIKSLENAIYQCNVGGNVVLVFACDETEKFYGYAKVLDHPNEQLRRGVFEDPDGELGSNFRIEWHKLCELEYDHTLRLQNPFSGHQALKFGMDFQEIEEKCGIKICNMIKDQAEEERRRRRHRDSRSGRSVV